MNMTNSNEPDFSSSDHTIAAENLVSIGDVKSIWQLFTDSLRLLIPDQAFNAWILPLSAESFNNETLTIRLPGRFYYEWIEGHYSSQMEQALRDTVGEQGKLNYIIDENSSAQSDETTYQDIAEENVAVAPTIQPQNYSLTGLKRDYQFDKFIEGPNNQFACAAAQAIADSPQHSTYNPLLVYGGVGLGKTHLLQAIGNSVSQKHPELKVKYLSSDLFTREFINAIRDKRANEFSSKYRSVDVLLLDDVQFLAGRERTQWEFFHTFNALHQAGKQIVLSADRPPRELEGLDDRLVSRIGWGLVTDISPPDFDTRLAIVQNFVEKDKNNLLPEVLDLLAHTFTRNVRELQGAAVRLIAHTALYKTSISIEKARELLSDLLGSSSNDIPIDLVQRLVADHYHVPADLLIAKVRTKSIARARMIAMALSMNLTGLSLKQVGRQFGNRDHTTVLHARRSVDAWAKDDREFASTLDTLSRQIQGSAA